MVEQALAREAMPFIANDADLSAPQRLWLLTGPNMAGKSTFLRQNALIAILAQAGSFVPAEHAHIGVVDRLFSRVGAADDLARGRSTFMVEMVETAAILNQATPRSLVILDEIGRGTATFDGLSIAWAVVEHLHEVNRCRALFATHFHELTALAAKLDRLVCRTMRVKEWQGDVVFLHEVGEGAADRSYGVHVARLAGLPEAVLARAEAGAAPARAGRGQEHGGSRRRPAAVRGRRQPRPAHRDAGRRAVAARDGAARGAPGRTHAQGRARADLSAESHARSRRMKPPRRQGRRVAQPAPGSGERRPASDTTGGATAPTRTWFQPAAILLAAHRGPIYLVATPRNPRGVMLDARS